MKRYREWAPSQFDTKGLGLEDRQDWFVAPVMRTRDSDALARSNFRVVLADLGGESETVEVHRFGHWGPGWIEIVLVHPDRESEAEAWEAALSGYPIASDEDFSREESEEADVVWASFTTEERVAYIREHRSEFEACFARYYDASDAWRNLLECVRGRAFFGYASELLG